MRLAEELKSDVSALYCITDVQNCLVTTCLQVAWILMNDWIKFRRETSPLREYFKGYLACMNFLNSISPCANNFFVLHLPPPSSKSFLMVLPQAKRVLQQVPWCPCISWLPRKLIQSGVSIQVTCNNLVYCKTGLTVDGKTCNIAFNTFCSKVAKQGEHFCCPLYCSFSLGKLATCADFVARVQLLSTFCNIFSQPATTWLVAGQVWFVAGKTPVNSFSSNVAIKVARFCVAYLTVPEIRLY